ncbi:MAG: DUF1016 family protein [Opitutales bacterium]|nr:DUF1016 family protein [Opitutales bacterium]
MKDQPISLTQPPTGYAEWLGELRDRIQNAQQRASLAVNRELVLLYWQIGRDILARQASQRWGAKVIDRLAHDLRNAFPEMKGFSPRNLKYMRAVAEAWPEPEFVQQAAAQLPWFHLCTLIDKLATREARDWYLAKAVEHAWSRNVLVMQIETRLLERQGKAGKFKPKHLGQLGFYLTAIDRQVKADRDNPTIGLLRGFIYELITVTGLSNVPNLFAPHLSRRSSSTGPVLPSSRTA